MSVVRVFARCNGGHYFVGKSCPFDGWRSEDADSIGRAAEGFLHEGTLPSMAALEAAGLTPTALARACVIEFYSNDQALDAIQPNLVAVDGRSYLLKGRAEERLVICARTTRAIYTTSLDMTPGTLRVG